MFVLESELKYNWNVFEYMGLILHFFEMFLTSPYSSFYQIEGALLPLILLIYYEACAMI